MKIKKIDLIKEWYPLEHKRSTDDLVIHFRAGDRLFLKNEFDYKPSVKSYINAIKKFDFENLYIVTDMPNWEYITAEKLNNIHFSHVKKHGPLTKPTAITPVYNLQKNHLRMHNGNPIDPSLIDCGIHYIRKPEKVEWGYVVTDGQALYNASASTDFELHGSDETILIGKILGLAGVIMQKPDLAGAGQQQA